MKSKNRIKIMTILVLVILLIKDSGCKKAVEIDAPSTSTTEASVYSSDATSIAVLTGLYSNMSLDGIFTGNGSISLLNGLSADELTLYNGVTSPIYSSYYTNSLFSNGTQTIGAETWPALYLFIYTCNAAIEGINNSTTLTPAIKNQLLGEAKFLRGFYFFYLVNLYGDVPLATTTDYKINNSLSRAPKAAVFAQIVKDLSDAQNLLSSNYLDISLLSTTSERVRPTKWAAMALLARTYLFTQQWDSAEAKATLLINNTSQYGIDSLNAVFLANSTEAIWQLQPVILGHNTEDAWTFIIPSSGPSDVNGNDGNPVFLSQKLINSFEPGDERAIIGNWIDTINVAGTTYYFPYKYKNATLNDPVTEYLMVLRLGEQYLIRAEARVQQGDLQGGTSDLNVIRTRAGLLGTNATTEPELLTAILHERQIELFTEWGHRWQDIKRTLSVDSVMNFACPQKGASWKSFQQLYPILSSDILGNTNLVQNPGY